MDIGVLVQPFLMDIANNTELMNKLRMHNEGSLYQCTYCSNYRILKDTN